MALFSVGCESAATRYEKHVASGEDHLTNGRLQEAILSFKSALAARPADLDARKLLTECYLERGAKEPARELIEVLSTEVPDDPEIPLLEVRLALLDDDADRALEVLQGYMAVHGET
ncbi:MAG: tetratricopeptide repeat protein, partial [Nitrospirota bacterium]